MAMIDRLVKNAFNKEGFETLLNFSQKHLSEGAFDVMQKGFRGEKDYIFNAKVIKKALKKNDILETGDMVKYIKKYDSDGMFSEALDNLNKPRSPGPRPEKPNINKKGKEEKPEKLLKRQLEHDTKQQAYDEAIVKYDEAVTDIYNQLKKHNTILEEKPSKTSGPINTTVDPDPVPIQRENIERHEQLKKEYEDFLNNIDDNTETYRNSNELNYDGTPNQEVIDERKRREQIQQEYDDLLDNKSNDEILKESESHTRDEYVESYANGGASRLRTDQERKAYRQKKINTNNIENRRQEASRKEQQQQIEYANKGPLGKLWTNLTGHAQVKYNDDGSIANALWARNTINSAYSPVERAVKSGKIDIVQGDEAKYTKQGFISNFGNRFDVYGDVYGQSGISQSFFQSLGYDGIGDFAKNNQLIVAGAIAGAGIGTAGIASAVSRSKNRGY